MSDSNTNPPVPNGSGSLNHTALPQLPQQQATAEQLQGTAQARSSFHFLRRKSSSETRGAQRSVSGGKMSKKQRALAQEEALRKQREAAMLPKQPPRLPSHPPLPQIDNFGGEEGRPDSVAIISNNIYGARHNFSRPAGEHRMAHNAHPSVSAAPSSPPSYMNYDPYPRTETMTHRGRYSYASSVISTVNSPRRVRRRKDPTPFK
jgi:hypothetical protein